MTLEDGKGEPGEVEIGVFKDQDYDQIRKKDDMTCEERRALATELIKTKVPLDGSWSDKFVKGEEGLFRSTITT